MFGAGSRLQHFILRPNLAMDAQVHLITLFRILKSQY